MFRSALWNTLILYSAVYRPIFIFHCGRKSDGKWWKAMESFGQFRTHCLSRPTWSTCHLLTLIEGWTLNTCRPNVMHGFVSLYKLDAIPLLLPLTSSLPLPRSGPWNPANDPGKLSKLHQCVLRGETLAANVFRCILGKQKRNWWQHILRFLTILY